MLNVRAAKAGFNIVEVPSYEQERIHGLSNLNAWRDGSRVLKTILSERFSVLPEPSDAWRPPYAELASAASPVRPKVLSLVDAAPRAQRVPLTDQAAARAWPAAPQPV